MSIRFATLADIPALVEAGNRMHALTRFRNQPFNAQKTAEAFASLIQHDRGRYVFFVAEGAQQRIVGALIGVMEKQIFSDLYTASVMHFDVLPEARMGGYGVRLLRAFEQWALNREAFEIYFGINSDTESVPLERFASRMGYRRVGGNFVKGMG
ncbi:GNAT family N-acetyltransferase [Methylibium rhizosphaerae]|uniref:GNAT family N-acetyltransferase n=1 Tax=Methylibium rhizosphaerae TaxID=2570323 RepID=UPI00112B6A96|nr:GNAT family N-acetyltransferase [Methylibium rhizosphaerae]